jgi:hypothetical protein
MPLLRACTDFMSLMYAEAFPLNNDKSHFTNKSAHPTKLLTNPFPIMPLLPHCNQYQEEHNNKRRAQDAV